MENTKKHPDLSEREQQLIALAAKGYTDTAIANRLGISEPTVKSYWLRVRSKLGPYNRTELVAHALREETERTVSELNGEIQRLKDALNQSNEAPLGIHQVMLENAPDAVFAVDQEGCFVWLNLEAERMFGYRFDEIVCQPVSLLVPAQLHDRHRLHMSQFLSNPEKKKMGEHLGTKAVRKDGEEFLVAASLASIDTPNGPIVICFLRDISEEKALHSFVERLGVSPAI